MEFYYDKEQVAAAGAVAFSKYGKVRNSKDLKVPREMIAKCGEGGKAWFREVAPKTLALEQGDYGVWEEQLRIKYRGFSRLRLLRMAKCVGENSVQRFLRPKSGTTPGV